MRRRRPREGTSLLEILGRPDRSCLGVISFLLGLTLLGAGGAMLVYGLGHEGNGRRAGDLTVGVFGVCSVAVGTYLFFAGVLTRLAHDILEYVDSACKRKCEGASSGVDEGPERDRTTSVSGGDVVQRWLTRISMQDLTPPWRFAVIVAIVLGGLSLLFAVGAWQISFLAEAAENSGIRLDYLALASLALLMLAPVLMAIGAVASAGREDANR